MMGYSVLLLSLMCAMACYVVPTHSYENGFGPACQNVFDEGPEPKWGLPVNFWAPKRGKTRGDWLNPIDRLLISQPQIPPNIQLPTPLLPTENKTILGIYHQAMTAYVHDLYTNDYDRKAISNKYIQDAQCWLHQYDCRASSWPWMPCYSDNEAIMLHVGDTDYSFNHGELTFSLLQRSYFIALVDLGHSLIPLVNYFEKFDDTKRDIPKFAIHVGGLITFYSDPKHAADHKAVSEPHLPLNIALPEPLLSKTDAALLRMYRDALSAYDEDRTHSARHRRHKRSHHKKKAWQWIVEDPCYYADNLCNLYDGFTKTLSGGFMESHEAAGKALRAEMEREALVDLGGKLLDETRRGGGSPADLKLALGFAVDGH